MNYMQAGYKKIQTLPLILLLLAFFSCSERQTKAPGADNATKGDESTQLEISAIDVEFPLNLGEVDLNKNNRIHFNDGIVSKIVQTIHEYYDNYCLNDSLHSYKDTYIATLHLRDSLHTIFLVLLKNYPNGTVHSKALFYDNQKREFVGEAFDFNLHVLYDYDNGKFKPSNLKTMFQINSPEIEVVDYDRNGVNDYKFVRLWHNGTFNAVRTVVLGVRDGKVDTLRVGEEVK